MPNDMIRRKALSIVMDYPVKRIVLFGSHAEETNHENSDVDLNGIFGANFTFYAI